MRISKHVHFYDIVNINPHLLKILFYHKYICGEYTNELFDFPISQQSFTSGKMLESS